VIVVIDTNVLVSGLLNPHGPPGQIVRLVASSALRLCYDARILVEYTEVLSRPRFAFDTRQVDALLAHIRTEGVLTAPHLLARHLPDPDDEPFLEAAIVGNARYLITGNKRHFPSRSTGGTTVVSARRFLNIWRLRKEK